MLISINVFGRVGTATLAKSLDPFSKLSLVTGKLVE